jgi:hypothetical protein
VFAANGMLTCAYCWSHLPHWHMVRPAMLTFDHLLLPTAAMLLHLLLLQV